MNYHHVIIPLDMQENTSVNQIIHALMNASTVQGRVASKDVQGKTVMKEIICVKRKNISAVKNVLYQLQSYINVRDFV